ncbi:hypothetical protein VNO80_30313 [Phaseolus coccineus]|uniref:Disease resistance RPP13-like protein 4 n=1 Tax=Phaseolus coccineus TaxID=3886 RepID=A0AAN9LG81_PHACN
MSIRTNRMKAVPSLQRRLTSVQRNEEPHISDKLEKLMSELKGIQNLFKTVKNKEEELLDTLKIVDDLLRNFRTDKFFEISNRILHPPDKADPQKGTDEPSSSDEAKEKSGQKDEMIDEKLENLKCTLDNLKDNFSTLKKNEELRKKLREVENFLQCFNSKLAEDSNVNETKGLEQPSQTSKEEKMDQHFIGGTDKPSSSHETEDKKSIAEKDISINEKFESLKSKLDKTKAISSTVKENEEFRTKLRIVKNTFQNFNAKNSSEIVKPSEDSKQSETKSSELPRQKSRDESPDQDFKAIGADKQSSSQEIEDKKSVAKYVSIDEELESLKLELEKMKAMSVKENEELHYTLRTLQDFLQNIDEKGLVEIVKPVENANQSETKGSEKRSQTSMEKVVDQDFKVTGIDKMKAISSTMKEDKELREKLRVMEDLLRNFNGKRLHNIGNSIEDSNQSEKKSSELLGQTSRDELVDQDLKTTGVVDKPSSDQEPEKYVAIDEKLESLKLELDNMKAKFSPVKENEEMRDTLRTLEDLLQSFDKKGLAEIVNPAKDATQSEAKGSELTSQISRGQLEDQVSKGFDKSSLNQETQDKESVEKDVSVDEKVESLKSEIDNKKANLVTLNTNELPNLLRAEENLIKNTNKNTSGENVKREVSKEERVDEVVEAISKRINISTKKLGFSQTETKANESSEKGKTSKAVHYPILSLSRDHEDVELVLKRFQASYDALDSHSKVCCLSLSIFPENVVIMKRHIIYWWIGEGFVKESTEKTAEEKGEYVFDELLNSNLIVAHGMVKWPVVNKFKINPWIRHMLVSSFLGENKQPFGFYSQIITPSHHNNVDSTCLVLDQQKVQVGGEFDPKSDCGRSVFNLGAKYLTIEPRWMAKMKKLVVLQLGRWQESPSHHIEVASTEFMTDLKAQKHLKYFSLRGISRISELPPSIAQLVSLQILDLKACHNLETLPVEITSLRKLTHLDVSQCYLLERMPKGIEKLTELQVLKGFVVGNSNNKTPRISDLVNFKKLKRLSIHIGSEAVIQDKEFESLKDLLVKCLKISWGLLPNTKYQDIDIFLPQSLEKLNLEGLPSAKTPKWLKLNTLPPGLKRLYIVGGKLTSIEKEKSSTISCKVEFLRLKYLKKLQIDLKNLGELFPSLKYAEVDKTQIISQNGTLIIDGESTPIS